MLAPCCATNVAGLMSLAPTDGRGAQVVLRRRLTVLLATVMMVMMSAAPALAHHDVGHVNASDNGNKPNDGLDANQGGGQEKPKNARPDHGGGVKHGGGEQHGGGSV